MQGLLSRLDKAEWISFSTSLMVSRILSKIRLLIIAHNCKLHNYFAFNFLIFDFLDFLN